MFYRTTFARGACWTVASGIPILHGEAGEEYEERRGAVADKEMQRDDGTAGHPVQLPGVGKC